MVCGRVFLENGDWFFLLVTLIFAWSLIRGIPWFFPTRIIFDRIRFWKQGIIWGRWEEKKVDEIKKNIS
ncbi:hypothetical protein EBT31_14070 [bacterium]|nr:hypothetical protein [bacterium]